MKLFVFCVAVVMLSSVVTGEVMDYEQTSMFVSDTQNLMVSILESMQRIEQTQLTMINMK